MDSKSGKLQKQIFLKDRVAIWCVWNLTKSETTHPVKSEMFMGCDPDLWRHQAHIWCVFTYADKTLIHIK